MRRKHGFGDPAQVVASISKLTFNLRGMRAAGRVDMHKVGGDMLHFIQRHIDRIMEFDAGPNGRGRNDYALAQYGLDEAAVVDQFGDYIRRFSIPRESEALTAAVAEARALIAAEAPDAAVAAEGEAYVALHRDPTAEPARLRTQYFLGSFDLADGEWLEVTMPADQSGSWSVHAYNYWFEHLQTPGADDRHARADADGRIRIAIGSNAPNDTLNRIDTLGRRRGALICRIIGVGGCRSAHTSRSAKSEGHSVL